MPRPRLSKDSLAIDPAVEIERIVRKLATVTRREFHRRGAVVALSGGIDSSVSTYLAAAALGSKQVLALMLPEKHAGDASTNLANRVVADLGIQSVKFDISDTLEAIGCYRLTEQAIRTVFKAFSSDWKFKIVLKGRKPGAIPFFHLVVRSPDGELMSERLNHGAYLKLVSAMNFKQRIRKTMEYYYADLMNYVVIGTPNRVEFDQGFFVKNGDGSADIKPIAHLYKSQVYSLARHLRVCHQVLERTPSTDTYSLPQDQSEFYFSLPFPDMDYALWSVNNDIPVAEFAAFLDMDIEDANWVYGDIIAKRNATRYNHHHPVLIEEISEISS